MIQQMQIDDQMTVGGQPDEIQLAQLANEGFKTVVNMRTDDEEDQPLSPAEEGTRIRELGIDYVHFPVSRATMSNERVDEFRENIPRWSAPVFVHCSSGKRAGAFVMMDRAVKQGWTGEETLDHAKQMGFECNVPDIKELVKHYVDSHWSG